MRPFVSFVLSFVPSLVRSPDAGRFLDNVKSIQLKEFASDQDCFYLPAAATVVTAAASVVAITAAGAIVNEKPIAADKGYSAADRVLAGALR